MRSFAAIATFAALALSVVTSALPTGTTYANTPFPSSASDLDVSAIDIDVVVKDLHVVIDTAANLKVDLGGSLAISGVAPGPRGIPDVLVDVTTKVSGLVQGLTGQINADIDAQAALDIALKVFAQIQVLLHGAVVDIQAIVNGDINVVLYLGGKAQDVKVVAEVLAALLETVVLALGLVVKVCISIDIKALLAIVVDIAGSLSIILGLVVKVAAGIVVELQTSIHVIAHIVIGLRLQVLAKVLCIA